jgi:Phosphotransferase enzyme family
MLAELQPGRVPDVVAVDAERGWMLMRDGGTRLREVVKSPADLHHWERLLPDYAQLQVEVAPHAETLLALGVPDERLSALSGHFRELLAARPPGLTPKQHQRLVDAAPAFEDMCRELAAYGIPETIQHDDLHDGQVFVRDGHYRFFDWGDSCVSHPFHSLTVILRAIAWKLDLDPAVESFSACGMPTSNHSANCKRLPSSPIGRARSPARSPATGWSPRASRSS